jgi:hypothetical protein
MVASNARIQSALNFPTNKILIFFTVVHKTTELRIFSKHPFSILCYDFTLHSDDEISTYV